MLGSEHPEEQGQVVNEAGFVSVGVGRSVFVETRRTGSLCTIFFMHGSMATRRQFEDVYSSAALVKYNIVAYDALGCGASEKPRDWNAYSTDRLTEDAITIFKKYATKENILVGHSFGSSLVARVNRAVSRAHSVVGVVLIGTADHVSNGGHPVFRLPLFILRCLHSYLSAQFDKKAFSPKTSPFLKKKCKSVMIKNDMFIAQAFYRQLVWAASSDWSSITCPVLVIQGVHDQLTSPTKAISLFDTHFAGVEESKLVLVHDAGHQVMQEKAEEVAQRMQEFFELLQK